MTAIRIVIADDHAFYREGVKAMLAATYGEDVVVIGEASTGDEAVRLVTQLEPDVVLMDLKMPGLSGIEATRRLTQERHDLAVLVLTMFDDESVFTALRAGARGYVLKDATVDDLVRAVTAVHRGEAIFSPSVARRVIRAMTRQPPDRDPQLFPELTEREHDVLRQLVAGRANHEIAVELHLTPKTVRNYVSAVLAKLQVADRTQAVVRAHEVGYAAAEESMLPPERA